MKHHHDLGISFAEFGALLGTKAMLEARVLKPEPSGCVYKNKHGFDMGTAAKAFDCGSVSCIGGTMGFIMGMNSDDATEYVTGKDPRETVRAHPLGELFFPGTTTGTYRALCFEKITPKDAVYAIERWLRGNRKPWTKKVLKKIGAID